jgi:hypothetical protein
MPNLDGLRNKQPEEPEVPEAVPSTQCSPSQPDCNQGGGLQVSYSHAVRSKKLVLRNESYLSHSAQRRLLGRRTIPELVMFSTRELTRLMSTTQVGTERGRVSIIRLRTACPLK